MPRARSQLPPWITSKTNAGRNAAKRRRLLANGLAPPGDKPSLRAAADQAARERPPRKV